MSRIINRLVEASGGWEVFLYKTLKGVCKDASALYSKPGMLKEKELLEIIEEAVEILEAYEALADGHPDQESKRLVVVNDQSIEEASKPTQPNKYQSHTPVPVEVIEPVEIKLEDFILTPAPRVSPKPRRLTGKIGISKDAGESQGMLSIPSNHKLVNGQSIIITTEGNLELGRAASKSGLEGQITGQGVRGHVSMSGKYRLVFTDNTLGIGLIHYDVVMIPPKMNRNQFEKALALQNGSTIESLQTALQSFEKVIVPCQCGKEDCYGWKVVTKAEVEEAETQRQGRMAAVRNANTVGGVR